MTLQNHIDTAAKLCNCKVCPLRHNIRVPTHAPKFKPRMALVGESPGIQEEFHKRYFVGSVGFKLDQLIDSVGMYRENILLTNVLQCRIEKATKPAIINQAIECCRPRLLAELKASEISHINVQGAWAFKGISGKKAASLQDWVGCVQPSSLPGMENYTFVASYHVAQALRGNSQLYPLIREFLLRTWELADGSLQPFDWGRLYYYGCNEEDTLTALRRIHDSPLGTVIGYDIETGGDDPVHDPITALGVATKEDSVSLYWPPEKHFTVDGRAHTARKLIRGILEREDLEKTCHNGSHDVIGSEANGLKVIGYKNDTILEHHINGNLLRHGLQFAMACNYPVDPWKSDFHSGDVKGLERFLTAHPADLTKYNAKDTKAEPYLHEAEMERLQDTHNGQALYDELFELTRRTAKMQVVGIRLNKPAQKELGRKLKRRIADAKREILKVAKEYASDRRWGVTKSRPKGLSTKELNPRSNAQMHELFYEVLEVEPRSYTDSGAPSLTVNDLEAFCRHPNPDVVSTARALLRFRKWDKLFGVYVDDPKVRNGYFHPQWKSWGTKGGRFAAQKPPVQTSPPGARIIMAARPNRWIVGADYSQLELRIVAQLAKDKKLLEAYEKGLDVHEMNMYDLFPTTRRLKKGSARWNATRKLAKVEVYGANYGGSADTMHSSLVVDFPTLTIRDVRKFLKAWYMMHPAIAIYQEQLLRFAEEHDYVECPISGRRQYFHGQVEATKVYNYPIQGTAADIMNGAMLKVAKALDDIPDTDLILQVHDELTIDTAHPVAVAEVLHKYMVQTIEIDGVVCTYPVDYKCGPNWGECKKFDTIEEFREAFASGTNPPCAV